MRSVCACVCFVRCIEVRFLKYQVINTEYSWNEHHKDLSSAGWWTTVCIYSIGISGSLTNPDPQASELLCQALTHCSSIEACLDLFSI